MAVKILALGVSVYADVWVEAYGLAAPVGVEEGESAIHGLGTFGERGLVDSP
jgi:hypothetical protein